MSRFGQLVKKLRLERGMSLEAVGKKIGSHKGYVSGIENGKVNPPSLRFIQKFAKLFGQDFRTLVRLAWVDKAPEILRKDAEQFLAWCQERENTASPAPPPSDQAPAGTTSST